MAKQTTKSYTSKSGRFNYQKKTDTGVMTGRQKLKKARMEYKARTAETRAKASAIRAASANLGQAITGATGSIITGKMQSEMTKRAMIQSSAANQATNGGLSPSTDTRDEDEKDDQTEKNPWVY